MHLYYAPTYGSFDQITLREQTLSFRTPSLVIFNQTKGT